MNPLSQAEKIAEVENASVAAIWKRPDTRVEQRPGWSRSVTPSSPALWHNGVQRSVLSEEEAPRVVAESVADYRARGLGFRWVVGPSARPTGLEQLLEAQGVSLGYRVVGMVAPTDLRLADAPGVRIVRVTPRELDDYADANALGWGQDAAARASIHADLARSIADPDHLTLYYVAYCEGRPAGTGAVIPLARSGYLIGGSVAPFARGRGVYRALLAARFAELRARAIGCATIQAIADTSAPICQHLGFETVCELRIYAEEARKK